MTPFICLTEYLQHVICTIVKSSEGAARKKHLGPLPVFLGYVIAYNMIHRLPMSFQQLDAALKKVLTAASWAVTATRPQSQQHERHVKKSHFR